MRGEADKIAFRTIETDLHTSTDQIVEVTATPGEGKTGTLEGTNPWIGHASATGLKVKHLPRGNNLKLSPEAVIIALIEIKVMFPKGLKQDSILNREITPNSKGRFLRQSSNNGLKAMAGDILKPNRLRGNSREILGLPK